MTRKQQPSVDGLLTTREARLAEARKFNLLSDVFMTEVLKDPEACQHVLRIIMGVSDLAVQKVKTQYVMTKLVSHGVRLDVVAEFEHEQICNIEIQRSETTDHARRTRYYVAMLDCEVLEKGKDYDEMPEVYIFYISETDIWKAGKTVYQVRKVLGEEGIGYEDGQHVIYINAEVDDGSEIAKLMQYFKHADPEDMSQGALSKRVHFLKCEKGGEEIMCEISERLYQAGIQNGIRIAARNLFLRGMSAADAAGICEEKQELIEEWFRNWRQQER